MVIDRSSKRDVRYHACRCKFFNEHVWAVVTKQRDGSWKIVNCLDKHERCSGLPCVFATASGEWPFHKNDRMI